LRRELEALAPKDPNDKSRRDLALAAIAAGELEAAKSALVPCVEAKLQSAEVSEDCLARAGIWGSV
jgi:hypothetical protein